MKLNGNEATLKQVKFDLVRGNAQLIPNSTNDQHMVEIVPLNEIDWLVGKVTGMYMSI